MMTLSENVLAILALLPIVVVGFLLIGLRWSAARSMPLAYVVAVLLVLFIWRVSYLQVAAASIKGLIFAAMLLYIIFGAMLLMETLEVSGALERIRQSFHALNPDRRIQVIIVAWLFGSFMEGASGFGTPAAVCVPLLVGLRFPAAAAAMAGMIIQSTPVSFGAAGTPIMVGVRTGLGDDLSVQEFVMKNGWESTSQLLYAIGVRVACIHAILGFLIPMIVVCSMTRYFGPYRRWREGLAIWKFALAASLAMTIPYTLTAWLLGPEFPSLIGSLVGLGTMCFCARMRWLVPRQDPWDFAPAADWPAEWSGETNRQSTIAASPIRSLGLAWLPYLLIAAFLLATRLYIPLKGWLQSFAIEWPSMLQSSVGLGKIELLYSPGTIFIFVSLLTFGLHRIPVRHYQQAWLNSGRVLYSASLALLCAVPMVQVLIHSDGGIANYVKMPIALAEGAANLAGAWWTLLAPTIGGLGAFVAGSNTVSNMMFSLFQFHTAQQVGFSPLLGIALQAVGGAAGNMICVHNVVAACAVVGLYGREGWILRRTILPFVYYAVGAGIIGTIWMVIAR